MKNPVTFGITIFPKTNKAKGGKAPLYARITLNSERIELSLQRRITLTLWDERKSRLRGSCTESIQVNKSIDRIYNQIYESFRQLQDENKVLSAAAIKARYMGVDDSFKKLSDILDYHTLNMQTVLKPGTMKNYRTTEKYLYEFLGVQMKSTDIYLKQINYGFILDFEHFLRTYKSKSHRPSPTNNGVMKHLERFKKLMNLAQKLEWVQKDPFSKFALKFTKAERDFLSKEELEKIIGFQSSRSALLQTRDIFVFACYTGLSYIDVKNLSANNIVPGIDGNKWIYTAREKTDTPVKIPILPQAQELLEIYAFKMQHTHLLLPVYSNQKTNTYLKEIARLLEINKKLTFHVARHTFATTVTLSNGVPIETVSKLLGHSKLSTTQIYARVVERKVSEDINVLKDKLGIQEGKVDIKSEKSFLN
ncbi:site-specific integrase [Leeuwenhoekiella sp. A2]|uniref:site-specific integrase n=1 Tax=Leeuwenhoekiella sp. A2 TaxID=3141460 RepID=UPI003A811A73